MRTIETDLHDMLLDVAPDIHEFDEQAIIVAEATSQYREAEARSDRSRLASTTPAETQKSRLLDAVLAAMESIAHADGVKTRTAAQVENEEDFSSELSLKSLGIRLSGTMGEQTVLEDEDFDSLFMDHDHDDDDGLWELQDIYGDDFGRDSIYSVNGDQKKHRSQSLAR